MRPAPSSGGEATAERGTQCSSFEQPRELHLRQRIPSSASSTASSSLPPVAVRARRRMLVSGADATTSSSHGLGDAGAGAAAVHTVHVQVPVPADPSSINMSLRLNISTSTTTTNGVMTAATATAVMTGPTSNGSANKVDALASSSSSSSSSLSAVVVPAPAPVASAAGLPSPRVAARKRKGIAYGKKSSSRDKDSLERQGSGFASSSSIAPASAISQAAVVSVSSAVVASSSSSGGGGGASGGSRAPSPFEKLNTLKMLLDCGHLTQEEYQERKTQIINEMTGTSTERKKPSPRRMLQPIMKTVVPHNPPEFARIPKERAEKLSFDVDTLDWQATSTRIKLDLVPFATGQLRNAYFLQELSEGDAHLHVAKFSIRPSDPSSYLSDVEMQAVCAHYAELYNEHEPPLKVYYARSWLLKLKDRGDLVCSVEEYLPGAYVKYSNNNGYVGKETSTTEERERNTPHAFSHFTFVASDYRLMIVDIQGVQDSYTDPQIHTADGRGFGAGNLGTFGMEKFLETHRCNEVCRWLGLKSINKEYKPGGTAAPDYRMPFGEKIKKSTNRITEERNTFSRSVTVSEAFGGSDMLQAALLDEESFSSSVSTTATGSSSLLYGQQMMPSLVPSMDMKIPLETRPPIHRLSPHSRRGRSMLENRFARVKTAPSMESEATQSPGEAVNDGGVDANPSAIGEAKQATPITNAILSQAVTSAISQLDTKRAFDMMLLNEQMSAMEAENKCLKEEASFLRESLAKQSQETSEMYHYFHGKMDAHVATIGALETSLAATTADMEQLKEHHALELANAHTEFQAELSKVNAEKANLRDELFQVHVFSTQKKQMEEQLRELQEELDAKVKQFAEEKNALELKGMFEKDRVKKEMLVHMKDTKEALLLRTDEQLNTTTKRTMMENDHFMEELSFQSKETEKLLMRFRQVEDEVQRLRVTNKVLEENEMVMAKKNHYYQKILGQLKKQGKEPEKQTAEVGIDYASPAPADPKELQAVREEVDRLKTTAVVLEESLKHARQWVHAFQQEKQFVVAQQDEIIQFLCRALSDATVDLAVKQYPRQNLESSDGDALASTQAMSIAEAAKTTATMEELVTMIAPITLDELSTGETRDVLKFLLEKMKLYQDQVAIIYRGQKISPTSPLGPKSHDRNRELLSKQLGVELPPIAQPPAQIVSPLKVKRRIQPHVPAALNAPRPPPANQDFIAQQIRPKANPETAASPNRLLSMATSQFNFLQSTPSPVKKSSTHKLLLSPTKLTPRIASRRERDASDMNDPLDEPSLAVGGTQPSAWSTDSLPAYDPTRGPSDPSPPNAADNHHDSLLKNASVSRRKA